MTSNAWRCLDQPGGCGCGCHAIAAGRKASGKKSGPKGLWTRSMDGRLSRGIGAGESVTSIAKALHVSTGAVRNRIVVIGASLRTAWHTQADLTRMLRVSWRIVGRWRTDGLIAMERHEQGRWYRVADDEWQRFVREQAGILFDPTRMRPCELKRVAEVNAVANRRRAGIVDWRCTDCGTAERPHFAKGLCASCHHRAWYQRKRSLSEVAS